ncbi:LysE family translocator [Streptomyces sp. NPDC093801]|uniref:LysE family translocator n=1 Tax=Streptomyces sp. NPDC093801 TaxID=3155203 RepID=UPI003450B396
MNPLAAFALATVVLVAVPGPNLLYIVTRSVQDGRRAGIVSALGVESGTLVHFLVAVCGLATVITDHPPAFAVLRYAGAGYLAWLGVRALLRRGPSAAVGRGEPGADGAGGGGGGGGGATAADRPDRRRLLRLYRDAVLVNVLNPKVVLFFLAFLPQFVPAGLSSAQTRAHMLVLGAVFLAIALAFDLCYALVGAALAGRLRGTPRRDRRLSYVTGGVHLGLAALVLV